MSLFSLQPSRRLSTTNLIDQGYQIGAIPSQEVEVIVPRSRRSYRLAGMPADAEYTFMVAAIRNVDPDVAASGRISTTPRVAEQRSYQPAQVPNITANIWGRPASEIAASVVLVNNISNDNVLASSEKPDLILEWTRVQAEYAALETQAAAFGLSNTGGSPRNNLTVAYNALSTYLNNLSGWNTLGTDTVIDGPVFRNTWSNYYNAVGPADNAISNYASTTANWTGLAGSVPVTVANSAITMNANGTISGAGGGAVLLGSGGLGYLGDLSATRNRMIYSATDPGAVEDGYIWGDTTVSNNPSTRIRTGGVWRETGTVGARGGLNLRSSADTVVGDTAFLNSAITMNANGTISGAGGGGVVLGSGGLGYLGDLSATRNRVAYTSTDPGSVEDGYIWGDTTVTNNPSTRIRTGGLWRETGTVGARGGLNLRSGADALVGDTGFLNSAITLTSTGGISGAGGGAITALDYANVAGATRPDANATRNRMIYGSAEPVGAEDGYIWGDTTIANNPTNRIRIGGIWRDTGTVGARGGLNLRSASDVLVADTGFLNSAITLTSTGGISGAGGGAITALDYGNIAGATRPDANATRNRFSISAGTEPVAGAEDGYIWSDTAGSNPTQYIRQGGVWRSVATIGAKLGVNFSSSTGVTQGDTAVLNSAITLTSTGGISGAGGGAITALDYGNIAGATRPANNATVGARVGTNTYASDGTTILDATALQNDQLSLEQYQSGPSLAMRLKRGTTQYGAAVLAADYGATVGARMGTNLVSSEGTVRGDTAVLNSAVTLTSNGGLNGAGGGSITALDYVNIAGATRPANYATQNRDGANMIPDPITMTGAVASNGAYINNANTVGFRPVSGGYQGVLPNTANALVIWENTATKIPCLPGETLYVSHAATHSGGNPTTDGVIIRVQWYDASGAYINEVQVDSTWMTGNDWNVARPLTRKGSVVAPSNAGFVRIYSLRVGTAQSGSIIVGEPYLGRSEQGADITSGITGESYLEVQFNSDGTAKDGQLPKLSNYKLFRNGVHITSGITWTLALISGTMSASQSGTGTLTLSVDSLTTSSVLRLQATYQGAIRIFDVHIDRKQDAPPPPSGNATSVSTSSISSSNTTGYGAANTAVMRVKTGSSGIVNFSAPLEFYIGGTLAGSINAAGKWLIASVGGSYVDVATEVVGSTTATNTVESGVTEYNPGYINVAMQKTGLSANTEYDVYLDLRNTSGARTLNFTGTATASGA